MPGKGRKAQENPFMRQLFVFIFVLSLQTQALAQARGAEMSKPLQAAIVLIPLGLMFLAIYLLSKKKK